MDWPIGRLKDARMYDYKEEGWMDRWADGYADGWGGEENWMHLIFFFKMH